MRRIATVPVLAVAVLAGPSEARHRTTANCGFAGAVTTLAANAHARVVQQGEEVRACRHRERDAIEVGIRGSFQSIDGIRLRGPFLAYREVENDSQGRTRHVGVVVDLRTGSRVLENAAFDGPLVNAGGASVSLTTGGVERDDPRGHALVDRGDAIESGSLALNAAGDRFYWMRGGEPQTSDLAAPRAPARPTPPRVSRRSAVACGLRGRIQTVDANSFGRVVRRPLGLGGWRLFACAADGTARRALGDDDGFTGVSDVMVTGRRLAYLFKVYDRTGAGDEVIARVRSLRTGRVLREVQNVAGPVVLTASGTLFTMTDRAIHARDSPTDAAVERHDATGTTQLDAGLDVDPRSLALSEDGRRIYWTREGVPRSALV